MATQNCSCLLDLKKRKSVFEYYKQQHFDIVIIQEAHSNINIEFQWKSNSKIDGNILYNHSQSRGAVQIILLKHNDKILEHNVITPGRLHKAEIEINQLNITLYNIYSPNIDSEQINFYTQLLHYITEEKPSDMLVIGGDFNLIQNFKYD